MTARGAAIGREMQNNQLAGRKNNGKQSYDDCERAIALKPQAGDYPKQ